MIPNELSQRSSPFVDHVTLTHSLCSSSATAPISSILTNTPNFISFSSSVTSKVPSVPPPAPITTMTIDPKSTLCESVENKSVRLRTFANQLRQTIETVQTRTGNSDNDHAIEHIYQVGTQQRLFVDYRPDSTTETTHSHGKPTNAFLTQTFYGKLYIDDVYICSGQGTNKKFCKRNCFQEALNLFLTNDFEVKSTPTKEGRQQHELVSKVPSVQKPEKMEQDLETFGVPTNHPMNNTKMQFVQARDTSTIAGRTARQQSQLEHQYWQRFGYDIAPLTRPKRVQRSFSPPPPVPHQQPMNPSGSATIEALSTTPARVAVGFLLLLYHSTLIETIECLECHR